MANQYYGQQVKARNGAGTYKGFTPPVFNEPLNVALYSVTPSDTDIVIEGRALRVNGTMSGRVVQMGQVRDWKFTGDLLATGIPPTNLTDDFFSVAQTMGADINSIVADAQHYFRAKIGQGKIGWHGYTVPQAQASQSIAWYTATPSGPDLVIEGQSKKYSFLRRAVLDSVGSVTRSDSLRYAGVMKVLSGATRTSADSVRDIITNDFKAFASRARQYRNLPLNAGGGGGKYTGYLSAQTASLDGKVQYEFLVDTDVILLKAESLTGYGTMSAKVDVNGNLSSWYYAGKLAE